MGLQYNLQLLHWSSFSQIKYIICLFVLKLPKEAGGGEMFLSLKQQQEILFPVREGIVCV